MINVPGANPSLFHHPANQWRMQLNFQEQFSNATTSLRKPQESQFNSLVMMMKFAQLSVEPINATPTLNAHGANLLQFHLHATVLKLPRIFQMLSLTVTISMRKKNIHSEASSTRCWMDSEEDMEITRDTKVDTMEDNKKIKKRDLITDQEDTEDHRLKLPLQLPHQHSRMTTTGWSLLPDSHSRLASPRDSALTKRVAKRKSQSSQKWKKESQLTEEMTEDQATTVDADIMDTTRNITATTAGE